MADENKTNLPSASVDAIPKDTLADESVKVEKWGTTEVLPFQATARAPNRSGALKTVSDMLESRGVKFVDLKTEKNGSISMNFELPHVGEPEIVVADQHQPLPNSEWEIQKVIRFLNATMVIEFPGGDNKVMVVKVFNLPPEIEKKDVATKVENGKLVIELNTVQPVLEEYGKIKKFAELPVDATGSAISSLMEGQTLTVTIALEKPKPEEKPKSSSKIWRFAKGALTKAVPACLVMCGKVVLDETNNDEPNAEPEAEPNAEQE
ncbi:hypothetical protein WN943_026869 [Citrus x changshan-huyou]